MCEDHMHHRADFTTSNFLAHTPFSAAQASIANPSTAKQAGNPQSQVAGYQVPQGSNAGYLALSRQSANPPTTGMTVKEQKLAMPGRPRADSISSIQKTGAPSNAPNNGESNVAAGGQRDKASGHLVSPLTKNPGNLALTPLDMEHQRSNQHNYDLNSIIFKQHDLK